MQIYSLTWMKKIEISLIFTILFFMQIPSYSAMLETYIERTDETVYAHILLTVSPQEEVSGIQMEYGYNPQNCEFVTAFPAENLFLSGKQLQIAPAFGTLRAIIVGFNNYPIASGELFTLQFNALSEKIDSAGFVILNAKLSSPQALPVNSTINNGEQNAQETGNNTTSNETADIDNANENDANFSNNNDRQSTNSSDENNALTNPVNTNNSSSSTGATENTITNTYPTSNTINSQAYAQNKSSQSYVSGMPSGYLPTTNIPYAHSKKQVEDRKTNPYKNTAISSPQSIKAYSSQSRHSVGNATIQLSDTSPTEGRHNIANSTRHNIRGTKNLPSGKMNNILSLPETADSSLTINDSKPWFNKSEPTSNSLLALNTTYISSYRGRSNECNNIVNITPSESNLPELSNYLIVLTSIIISILTILSFIPLLLTKAKKLIIKEE